MDSSSVLMLAKGATALPNVVHRRSRTGYWWADVVLVAVREQVQGLRGVRRECLWGMRREMMEKPVPAPTLFIQIFKT